MRTTVTTRHLEATAMNRHLTDSTALSTSSTHDQDIPMNLLFSVQSHLDQTVARDADAGYRAVASTHPVLCQLPRLTDALVALQARSCFSRPPRTDIVRALVALAQREDDALWSELLVVAYGALVRDLCSADTANDEADREAEGIACFLDAVKSARTHAPSISTELRTLAERRLAAVRVAQREWREVVLMGDMSSFADSEPAEEPDLPATKRGLERGASRSVSDAELLRTYGEHGALTDLVDEVFAGASEQDARRGYDRLKTRRARLAKHLRRSRRAA
jgi:hypothetical protein